MTFRSADEWVKSLVSNAGNGKMQVPHHFGDRMNKATIEQVHHLRGLVESVRGVISDLADCEERSRLIEIVPLFDKYLAALSSADSEPPIPRIALTEFINKYCSGDSALIACAEAAFFSFNLSAGTSPPSAHSDVSQDGGSGDTKPLWEELAEIGQDAAAKGAFDRPEAPALTDFPAQILAALKQELAEQEKHYGEVAACASTGDRLYAGERDCTEGVIKGVEYCIARVEEIISAASVQAAVEPIPIEYATDPDGELSLDWMHGDITISISIGGSGKLSWVTDVGGAATSGSREFNTNAQASPDAQAIRDQAMEDAPASLTSGDGEVRQAEADEREAFEKCGECQGARGHERAHSSTNYSWAQCRACGGTGMQPMANYDPRHEGVECPVFTADQMRVYAKAALAQSPARQSQKLTQAETLEMAKNFCHKKEGEYYSFFWTDICAFVDTIVMAQSTARLELNAFMLETLQQIVDADWHKWEELASPEEFVRWAKSRAMHAISKAQPQQGAKK